MTRYAVDLLLDEAAAARAGRAVAAPLTVRLAPGDALTLRGPNGSGKSSLLRAIAGVGGFSEGRAAIGGEADARGRARLTHYIGHRPGARGSLTARETLAFHRAVLGGEASIAAALERVGIAAEGDRPAGALSAGQLRRLALARLLVADRPVWLLDEPTAALDAAGAALVARMVAEHRADGGIAVVATHDAFEPEAAATATLLAA
ncbi:MAG: heme ABC exporter ATP-binding protein CcmA [Pseudomonadota bacterium]